MARLFDAEADPADGQPHSQDVMDMVVGDVQVQVRRTAPFTATEHARGAAMADLVSDVLERSREAAMVSPLTRRVGGGATPEYVVDGDSVSARIDDVEVGRAVVRPEAEEPASGRCTLRVDPAWQRRGIGTRLLVDAARLANALGAEEILLTTRCGQPGGAADGDGGRAARPDPDGGRHPCGEDRGAGAQTAACLTARRR